MTLAGKKAVITGASHGLGRAIALAFVREGAEVLLCSRNSSDLEDARRELSEAAGAARTVRVLSADVSMEPDVARLAEAAGTGWDRVDVLVCNAGVYGPKGPVEQADWSSWCYAFAVNLHGTVLCCRQFLPLLKKSRRGKIILLSGGGATRPLPFLSAYAASKAAVVRFGETLAEELKPLGIDVNMVAPGALNTRLLDEVLEAGPNAVGQDFYEASLKQKQSGGTPLERGAALCVYLAGERSAGITGKLISAVWDPWDQFEQHLPDLQKTDVYTLRRIVPKERGLTWG
jgi:NAD(P)-dependent dehydrogenase (short-subunit alcohol dehydrogenase family)